MKHKIPFTRAQRRLLAYIMFNIYAPKYVKRAIASKPAKFVKRKVVFTLMLLHCVTALAQSPVTITITAHNGGTHPLYDALGGNLSVATFFEIPLVTGATPIPVGASATYVGTRTDWDGQVWNLTNSANGFTFLCSGSSVAATNVTPNMPLTIPSSGALSYDIYLTGGCPGDPPLGTNTTNMACLTLNNATSQPQYYQFLGGPPGALSNFSGCSQNITVNGQSGNDANTANNFLAVYPGESVTVCRQTVDMGTNVSTLYAALANSNNYPCGIQIGQPRCVALCGGDEVPVSYPSNIVGSALGQPVGGSPGTATITPAGGLTGGTQVTNVGGTNAIVWPGGVGTNLNLLNQTGFSSVVQSVEQAASGIEAAQQNVNAQSKSNTAAIIAALPGTNTAPTNYPDAATISNTAVIASNTSLATASNNGVTLGGILSNAIVGLTNAAVTGAQVLQENYSNVVGGGITNPELDNGDGAGAITIANPTSGFTTNIIMGTGIIAGARSVTFTQLKAVLSWIIFVVTWVKMLTYMQMLIKGLLEQRQIQGAKQQVAGTNASNPIGLLYAGIVTVLIASFPLALQTIIATIHTGVALNQNAFTVLSNNPLWSLVTLAFPIGILGTAIFTYITFRYVIAWPLFILTSIIILGLVE